MIVTIDGPAGAGKSTVARELARRLGFRFLDTGAMYRAVGWYCLQQGVPLEDSEAIASAVQNTKITFRDEKIFCNGTDVTSAIRTSEVSRAASIVAVIAAVREEMLRLQREAAEGQNTVTEGRDQGTIVFPNAEFKFFVTASVQERARRRMQDLLAQGEVIELDALIQDIEERDQRDSSRALAPLRPAEDAVIIDTSILRIEDVLKDLEYRIHQGLAEED